VQLWKNQGGAFSKAGNFPGNHSMVEILNGVFKAFQMIM
jgi:hypothetical protein